MNMMKYENTKYSWQHDVDPFIWKTGSRFNTMELIFMVTGMSPPNGILFIERIQMAR